MTGYPCRLAVSFGAWLMLAAAAAPVAAQQSADSDEAPPRYRVEAIVFSQPPVGADYQEIPRSEPLAPIDGLAWPLRAPGTTGLGFARLPESELRLAGAARRIDSREGFRVDWHAAWEQPGLDRSSAQGIALPQGTLRVYLSRFLHAEVRLQRPAPPRPAPATAERPDTDAAFWVLDTSRRMRSAEQHYLDHPVMGVIIRVDPVEPVEPVAPEQ